MAVEFEKVHSVGFRVKSPESLISKIIRKKDEKISRKICFENYKTEIRDLIGIRILHVFKDDWNIIDKAIRNQKGWEFLETPIWYYRDGDSVPNVEGFNSKKHNSGYRSMHYIIKTKGGKVFEVQMRSLFEEAWGEIDHTVRYPTDCENEFTPELLMIFNRMSGVADEMGVFLRKLERKAKEEKEKIKKSYPNTDTPREQLKNVILSLVKEDKNIKNESKRNNRRNPKKN
jgi:ppGpp synthetase/RelA/SpoT-type nucleotidyltranferase